MKRLLCYVLILCVFLTGCQIFEDLQIPDASVSSEDSVAADSETAEDNMTDNSEISEDLVTDDSESTEGNSTEDSETADVVSPDLPEITAVLLESVNPSPESYFEYAADASEYQSSVLIAASEGYILSDFQVIALEYTETSDSQFGFIIIEELFSVEQLTAEKPLLLHLELPETIPWIGISYINAQNESVYQSITMSGLDGSPVLSEIEILPAAS